MTQAAAASIPPSPMEIICGIAEGIGQTGRFKVQKIVYTPGNAITDDHVLVTPENETSYGSVAVKAVITPANAELKIPVEKKIYIYAKEGPAQKFAEELHRQCIASPRLSEEKIILMDNRAGRCHH